MNRSRLLSILRGDDCSAPARLARLGLAVLEPFYRFGVSFRNSLFDAGLRKSARLARPVISIGNLTTGGTGKTPTVIELIRHLINLGATPAVLLRGYRSDQNGSDEAKLLVQELGPDTPVEADPDRVAAADRVLQRRPDVTVFVLDDAFQHRQVHRNLNLVLVDATEPFGLGHLLPRGLLREPVPALKRGDGVIVTRADQVSEHDLEKLDLRIQRITGQPPIAHAVHRWVAWRCEDGEELPLDTLREARVFGACGIGNPKAFERSLRRQVGRLLGVQAMDDHHAYTEAELRQILQDALAAEAQAVVTTEKDWVKWEPLLPEARRDPLQAMIAGSSIAGGLIPGIAASVMPVQVYRPVVRLQFLDGQDTLETMLRHCLRQAAE